MQVGDWVRRISGNETKSVKVGYVYKVKTPIDAYDNLQVHEVKGTWHADKFEPFVWKVGDSCKIVRVGLGIDPAKHVLPIGKIIHLESPMWETDIFNPYDTALRLYVTPAMLAFVNPDGSIVDMGEKKSTKKITKHGQTGNGLSTPAVPKPATEVKQRRYINRAGV
jgi:hypothetical protein